MAKKKQQVSLPYADNYRAILITVAINCAVVLLLNLPGGITFRGILWDSLICAAISTVIDMWIVHSRLKKMRALGQMPVNVPESRFMQRLPHNPVALALLYIAVFGALTVGFNAAILRFFGLTSLAFLPWLLYKLVYSTVLTVKITEYCIFRYVQPDWAGAGGNAAAAQEPPQAIQVRNPLPRFSVFKEIYGSVTGNLGMNILMGTALGGVCLQEDGSVVVSPTLVEGIPITGLIFGLIIGILITGGIVSAMRAIIAATPGILAAATRDRWTAWMPRRRFSLTCLVCGCVMVFSAIALPLILILFDLPILNFYQYTVFITAYATLLSKPVVFMLTRRCMQPDFIRDTLEGA